MEWKFIGSKESLADLVVDITHINYNALLNLEPLDEFSVAQRLSWAAQRKTTREEDRAYSLLGIFNINMPTLYGEGQGAFRRLQEEIMRRTPDQSLFAWTSWFGLPRYPPAQVYEIDVIELNGVQHTLHLGTLYSETFLASSLDFFQLCTEITAVSHDEVAHRLQLRPDDLPTTDYAFTPYGIRTQLPIILLSDYFPPGHIANTTDIPLSQWCLVILGCGHKRFPGHLLALVCYTKTSGSSLIESLYCGAITVYDVPMDLLPLSPASITRLRSSGKILVKTLYIPQPQRDKVGNVVLPRRHKTIKLVLSEKTREALSTQGYSVSTCGPDGADLCTHSVVLRHATHVTITINFRHTLKNVNMGDQQLVIKAHVQISGPLFRSRDTPTNPVTTLVSSFGSSVPLRQWNDQPSWPGSGSWTKQLPFREVTLDIPGGPIALTLRLGLTLAKINYYLIHIELKP